MKNLPSYNAASPDRPHQSAPVDPCNVTADESGAHARNRPKAAFLLGEESFQLIYPVSIRNELEQYVDFVPKPIFTEELEERLGDLADVEMIFSGWNAPLIDENFLKAAPKLRAVFYGAGSVRYFTTPAFWDRDILLTSSNAANAVPVSEYVVGVALLSLKQFWRYSRLAKSGDGWGDHTRPIHGGYRASIGIVSFGLVARHTLELLKNFDLSFQVYCPFLSTQEAEAMGVTLSTLDEIFSTCEVVSLHTPELPETRGLIQRAHFEQMKEGATFINTARGSVVREADLIEVAREREDLTFVLDVTDPEPPTADSPLLCLPNVILSPHIAGSMGQEIGRLGEYMLEELKRYLAGQPLRWQVTREASERMA